MISLSVGSGGRPSTRLPKQNLPLVALMAEGNGGGGGVGWGMVEWGGGGGVRTRKRG